MAGSEQICAIMVGGPTKGTRFRPLSLNVPKPLFPLAGQPMVHHPISACHRQERSCSAEQLCKLWLSIQEEDVLAREACFLDQHTQ